MRRALRLSGPVMAQVIVVAAAWSGGALLAQSPAARPGTDSKTLDSRLAALRAEATTLAGEQRTLLGRLRQLEVARETRLVELERTNASLATAAADVGQASRRLEAIDTDLRSITPEIRDRLVRTYKLLPLGYDRLLLSLDQSRSIDRAARVIAVIANRDRARLEHFQRLREQRQAELTRVQRERTALEALKTRLVTEEAALAEARAAQAGLLRTIREKREMNEQLVEELMAARDRLDRSVTSLRPSGAASPTRTPFPRLLPGRLDWPVAGRIEARFGRELSSRFGTVIVRNGVEIGAEADAPVRAVEAGRVAFADAFTGFGRVVILDHGDKSYTLYGHLAGIDVRKDDRVERGRQLGSVGTAPTGAPSLYFEVRIDGRPVDPVQWLTR